jgi:hypothetical protein
MSSGDSSWGVGQPAKYSFSKLGRTGFLGKRWLRRPVQIRVLMVLLSLAAGLIASEIPGYFNMEGELGQKVAFVAGGGIAVFVLVFLVAPGVS